MQHHLLTALQQQISWILQWPCKVYCCQLNIVKIPIFVTTVILFPFPAFFYIFTQLKTVVILSASTHKIAPQSHRKKRNLNGSLNCSNTHRHWGCMACGLCQQHPLSTLQVDVCSQTGHHLARTIVDTWGNEHSQECVCKPSQFGFTFI